MKRLLAVDLGGTHIRFRLLADEGKRPAPVQVIESDGARSFEDALDQWRAQTGIRGGLDAIGIAAAGPVAGGRAQVTNLDWTLDACAIERDCNVRRCLLVNDVAAIAWALPSLGCEDLRTIAAVSPTEGSPDGGTPDDDAARAVLAPGTGLGVSGLVPAASGGFAGIEGEGGHRTLAAHDAREWAIVTALAKRFGHASAERALSGPGIEATWKAIAAIDGKRCECDKTAAEIAADAFAGRDPIAQETIAVFTGFLGSVAGDLALTLGARAGVFIAGGIVPGWGERFDARRFLERFRAKGRFRSWLSVIPVHVVTRPHPGLVGVEHLLEHQIARRS
ncbi:MAG: glucokinase [Thiotrichales bacterium]|nr:glucokinase [Thiotrichales bacterium]